MARNTPKTYERYETDWREPRDVAMMAIVHELSKISEEMQTQSEILHECLAEFHEQTDEAKRAANNLGVLDYDPTDTEYYE